MLKFRTNTSAGQSVPESTPKSARGLETEVLASSTSNREADAQSALIEHIQANPASFVWNPLPTIKHFTERDFASAYNYFASDFPDRQVYAVSHDLFHRQNARLDSELRARGLSDYGRNRLWPFWDARTFLSEADAQDLQATEAALLDFWNSPPGEQPSAAMHFQTGYMQAEKRFQLGGLHFFKCLLPVRASIGRHPSHITLAFDSKTRGFYSLNARVRFEDPEPRFRYIDFVRPDLSPPAVRQFLAPGSKNQWKVLVVLDRHIGDNLSLFTTHVPFLAAVPNFEVTVDASLCPFFRNVPSQVIRRFLPGAAVNVIDKPPPNRADFDLVFDPYDWVADSFHLKPQNDSGAISIVSGIELARCHLHKRRRDILDIHMQALKRFGVAPLDATTPEFLRYAIAPAERHSVRQTTRQELLRTARRDAKIVAIFPFGLTPDRRYPTERLQSVMRALLNDPRIHLVLAGTDFDTPEMVLSAHSDWPGVVHPCNHRVTVYFNEPLEQLIGLMLASDAVVCMDSGPLHLARALRVNPIALYTGKVNKTEEMLSFPWFVEDGTAEILIPDRSDASGHVLPDMILHAVENRLRR